METTDGRLLDGRVRYTQPRGGFRTGIEPVLLAAAIPARAGERVLEGGCGAGAALLCLAWRVPRLTGLGVERDPSLVALARENAAANGWPGLEFLTADLTTWGGPRRFDHVLANPPYYLEDGTQSPDPAREAAKRGSPESIAAWIAALVAPLRHHGTDNYNPSPARTWSRAPRPRCRRVWGG